MKVSLPQHLMKPVEKWGKPAAIDISVGIADPDVGPWYSLGDRTGSEDEPHKPTNWSEPRARVLRKDEPFLTKLRQNVKSYQCNVTKIIMQTPGPGCLEKAPSNEIYVNISEYPLDNDFFGGKFYPAMNKGKHKKLRISNWMTAFWTEQKYSSCSKGKKKFGGWREGERKESRPIVHHAIVFLIIAIFIRILRETPGEWERFKRAINATLPPKMIIKNTQKNSPGKAKTNVQSHAISFRISSKGYVFECIDNGVLKRRE